MSHITYETRSESNEKVDRHKRYSQILECLCEANKGHMEGLTAKECAVMMMQKGYIPTAERGFTAPRMTELSQSGVIEAIGKKVCKYTGKKVAIYQIRKE